MQLVETPPWSQGSRCVFHSKCALHHHRANHREQCNSCPKWLGLEVSRTTPILKSSATPCETSWFGWFDLRASRSGSPDLSTPRGAPFVAIRPHSAPGDIAKCPHFLVEIAGDFLFFNYPITKFPDYSIPLPLPADHNDHNVYWVSEGAITMRSQFLLGLSDPTCIKPNIHAASRDSIPQFRRPVPPALHF